jgi:hypothetical protein
MRFDDGAADAKSHAGPVSLGSKKGTEDLFRLLWGQAHAGISDGHHNFLVFRLPTNPDVVGDWRRKGRTWAHHKSRDEFLAGLRMSGGSDIEYWEGQVYVTSTEFKLQVKYAWHAQTSPPASAPHC